MRLFFILSRILICLIMFERAVKSIDAQTYDNMTSLKTSILNNYDKKIIPMINQSEVINVTVVFSLITISEVDTVNSLMKMRAFLYLSWRDEKLMWSPSDYNGIEEIYLQADEVWIPPLTLGNGVPYETIAKGWEIVQISYKGYAEVSLGGTFDVLCGFSMIYWPFDKQACHIYFVPLYLGKTERMNFVFPSNPVYDHGFIHIGEWTYENTIVSYTNLFAGSGKDIIYTVKVRRQFTFYLLTLIIPLYCICCLGMFVFIIPCDSGERIGFAVTIMLSMAVFMTVLMDHLPKNSEPLPYMCVYANAIVCIAFIVNIINIFSLNLFHQKDGKPIGQMYRNTVHFVSRLNRKKSVKPEDVVDKAKERRTETPNLTEVTPEEDSLRKETSRTLEADLISKEQVQAESVITWKDVSYSIDKITFFIITPATILSSVVGAIYFAATSDYPEWAK